MKNGVDLRDTNRPGGRSELKNEPVSWMNKIRAGFAFVTVEPLLICLTLATYLPSTSIYILYVEKACRVDLNYTKEDCDIHKWDKNVARESLSMANELINWGNISESFMVVIVLIFVGAWSDLTGNRKTLMVVSISGRLVSFFGLVLATYFFEELPLLVTTLIHRLPSSLTGGQYVLLVGSMCYLADVTSLETRIFRMGIASTVVELCTRVALVIKPILTENLNYYSTFGVSTTLYLLGLLYTYFMIHDVVKPVVNETRWYKKIMRFCNPDTAWRTISVTYKSSPDRVKIFLLIAAYFVISGPKEGYKAVNYEYMTLNFMMDDAELSQFVTYFHPISLCGTLLAVILFSKCLKMHDSILGIIATASIVMSSCMLTLAPSRLWLYSAAVLDMIGDSSAVVIQSLGTKIIARQHIAKVSSLLYLIEIIVPLLYYPMYSKLYNNIKDIMQGAVFLVGAAMTAPAILIFIIIYKQFKNEERDRVTVLQNKELYAEEDYVTSL